MRDFFNARRRKKLFWLFSGHDGWKGRIIFEDEEGDYDDLWERIKYLVALCIFNTKDFKDFSFSVLI